jgi:adenylosuccinate synthase
MALEQFKSQILLDTGISMGDEGKGRLIPELIRELRKATGRDRPVGAVVKVNGGANAGHTSGGLKLNLFPAGVVESSVDCLAIGSGVVADPHKFHWEAAYLENAGYPVLPKLLIDERAMVSDIGHRLLDLGWEWYREHQLGEPPRGSTGRGISPAYADETAHFALHYGAFRGDRADFAREMESRLERVRLTLLHVCGVDCDQIRSFLETLRDAEQRANRNLVEAGLFPLEAFDYTRWWDDRHGWLKTAEVVEAYWQAGIQLASHIGDVREQLARILATGGVVIGEFGQAFWLDKRHGFAPNVTASHTLPAEFFLSTGLPLQTAHTLGVCKAYDTKVGTHTFVCRMPSEHPLAKRLSKLEFGVTTGRQRMVGWFDAVEKGDAIRYGGCDDIVINKLDALTYGGDWLPGGELLICTGYRAPDGSILRHVPRSGHLHRSVQPIYLQYAGWEEDISSARSFAELPDAAKRYVAAMVLHTLDVAYGERPNWPATVPNLRYIGVGPDPDQIIADSPPTYDLVALARS